MWRDLQPSPPPQQFRRQQTPRHPCTRQVCGDCFTLAPTDSPFVYNSTYHSAFWGQAAHISKAFDLASIRRVFEASDVIGISHYAPLPNAGLAPNMFGMPIDTTAYELAHWGVDLKVGASGGGL